MITFQNALGRLPFPDEPVKFLPEEIGKNRIESLPITDRHAFYAGQLPRHHKDPFDRMLIAQASVESLILLSHDPIFKYYDVTISW